MAISDRVLVLRHGRLVGEVATADTDRHELAEMMVGAEIAAPKLSDRTPGPALLTLPTSTRRDRGDAPGLNAVDLALRAGQITGLAGVSGNGQAALAALIGGLERPAHGGMELHGGRCPPTGRPRAALAAGIARIPEDRHTTGTIADFTLTENAVLERYADAAFSRRGWMDWTAAEGFAAEIIETYDVRCPGPDARIRLLSGGNMQKLILGRVLEAGPEDHPRQPADARARHRRGDLSSTTG